MCVCVYIYIYIYIYKAQLKNELTSSRNKTKFFGYCIIFLFPSKLSDLRPSSQDKDASSKA